MSDKFNSASNSGGGGDATSKCRDYFNYASPLQEGQSVSSNSKEKLEKIFFTVLDATDGRRYKVFLRPNDISKLKISKVRKTLSSASGKPPFSFDLLIGETVLLGVEDVTCAALGITPHTVLLMRPSAELRNDEIPPSFTKNADGDKSGELGVVKNVETFPASSVENILKELPDATADMPFLVDLNERQRALQAQLFEEAKRSQIFSALDSGDSGGVDAQEKTKNGADDHKNDESGFSPSTCLLAKGAHQSHDALADQIPEESPSCSDSFEEFIEGIVNKKTVTQRDLGGPLLSLRKQEAEPKTKTKGVIDTAQLLQDPNSPDEKPNHLELLLQGEQYYDMSFHDVGKNDLLAQNACDANLQSKNVGGNRNHDGSANVAFEKTIASCCIWDNDGAKCRNGAFTTSGKFKR